MGSLPDMIGTGGCRFKCAQIVSGSYANERPLSLPWYHKPTRRHRFVYSVYNMHWCINDISYYL